MTATIFAAAHTAARLADKMVAYRTRFATALRAAWATAKQTVTAAMKAVRTTTILETPATILLEEGGLLFGFLYLEHLDRNSYFFATATGLDPNAKAHLVVDGVEYRQNDYLATDLKAASRKPEQVAAVAQTLRNYRFNEAIIAKLTSLMA